MIFRILFVTACLSSAALVSCSSDAVTDIPDDSMDIHSFARPAEARTTHLDLDLDVDFETRVISGTARHTIESNGANEFILDTRDLNIIQVTLNDADQAITHTLGAEQGVLGRPLIVPIDATVKTVTVYYFTSPESAALGWLDPVQTADKLMPFLYTQGQAILGRTWIPVQDSPGIRFTYKARVQVPEGMLAVMSATNPTETSSDGVYHFEMKRPIPAYLIALAAGKIEFGAMSERTGIYAEPSVLEAAIYEFGETEDMVKIAEELYGPYLWGRYDIIVLPPSFPFGGMENPILTFATPTVIAGDRSLVSLIAHELAHSWSGNLVTNATWDDFWLNEGFTVYFERRIMEALYGDDYTRMLALIGKQDLEREIEELGKDSKDTHLYLDLEGRNPDDGMTDIAYEKGALLLKSLEEKAGRKKFDSFLKEYFDKHQFQTMSTERFITYVNDNLITPNNLDIDLDAWIFNAGLPDDVPVIESDRFDKVDATIAKLGPDNASGDLGTAEWTTHEWMHFIRHLPEDIEVITMRSLDDSYQFSKSGNAEIAAAWYEVAIEQGYAVEIMPDIEAFLVKVGRRKFLTPIYGAMKNNGMLEEAREIYAKARPNYHAVSTQSIDQLLDV